MVGKGTNMRQWVEIVIFPLVSLGSVFARMTGEGFSLEEGSWKAFHRSLVSLSGVDIKNIL